MPLPLCRLLCVINVFVIHFTYFRVQNRMTCAACMYSVDFETCSFFAASLFLVAPARQFHKLQIALKLNSSMNKSSLPPPHPSLPRPPVTGFQTQSHPGEYAYPAYYACSSHYAQAYYPQLAFQSAPASANFSTVKNVMNRGKGIPVHLMSTWYQPGNFRCSHPGCSFYGSQKSLELHKMDRHLIFPPDWNKRNKKGEWDADPSLKGYSLLHVGGKAND